MANPYDTKSYSFELPEELIASEPLERRDSSRLLVVNRRSKTLDHRSVSDLPSILDPGTVLVANNTRVFKARLIGERSGTGGKVEFFMLKNEGPLVWTGLMKTGARVQPGFRFRIPDPAGVAIEAEVTGRHETTAGVFLTAHFSRDPVSAGVGEVPLPPYIMSKRGGLRADELEQYNTVFGTQDGSVAAPTAGRHFTKELIEALKGRGMQWEEITLHVGIGTFKPVSTADLRDHHMHAESVEVNPEVARRLNAAKTEGRTVLAIGTTSTRTLEGRSVPGQGGYALSAGTGEVDLYIHPGAGYTWRFTDAMLTNFHLPESTLLMMISTFIGDLEFTLNAYAVAVRERYRFYSYGDAMLILDR